MDHYFKAPLLLGTIIRDNLYFKDHHLRQQIFQAIIRGTNIEGN